MINCSGVLAAEAGRPALISCWSSKLVCSKQMGGWKMLTFARASLLALRLFMTSPGLLFILNTTKAVTNN